MSEPLELLRCECCRRRPGVVSRCGVWVCAPCYDWARSLEPVRAILPRVLARLVPPTRGAA